MPIVLDVPGFEDPVDVPTVLEVPGFEDPEVLDVVLDVPEFEDPDVVEVEFTVPPDEPERVEVKVPVELDVLSPSLVVFELLPPVHPEQPPSHPPAQFV